MAKKSKRLGGNSEAPADEKGKADAATTTEAMAKVSTSGAAADDAAPVDGLLADDRADDAASNVSSSAGEYDGAGNVDSAGGGRELPRQPEVGAVQQVTGQSARIPQGTEGDGGDDPILAGGSTGGDDALIKRAQEIYEEAGRSATGGKDNFAAWDDLADKSVWLDHARAELVDPARLAEAATTGDGYGLGAAETDIVQKAARLYADFGGMTNDKDEVIPWTDLTEDERDKWVAMAREGADVTVASWRDQREAEDEVRELTKRDLQAYDIDPTQWAQGYYDSSKDIAFADLDAWMAHTAMWFNRCINAARANEPVDISVGADLGAAMRRVSDEDQRKLDFFDPATLAVPSLPVKREDTLHGAVDDLRVPY